MEVRMKTLMAGPSGTRHPGEIHDLSPKEAAMLVEGGYAEALGEMPAKGKKAEKVKPAEPVAAPVAPVDPEAPLQQLPQEVQATATPTATQE